MPYSMQLAPGYRLSPFPTELLRWRCSFDPPLPIERSGRWAWRVLGSGCPRTLNYGIVDPGEWLAAKEKSR